MTVVNRKPCLERLSIFVEGNFDYAHFLPSNERCFPLHGHTSTAELDLAGEADKSGMVMDYSEAKKLLNEVLSEIDHKLVAGESHSRREGELIVVKYRKFFFRLPAEYVFLISGDGTSENITKRLAEMIVDRVPPNISSMRLTVTEGLRKGASVKLERRS